MVWPPNYLLDTDYCAANGVTSCRTGARKIRLELRGREIASLM
jgi:hypothetical protein